MERLKMPTVRSKDICQKSQRSRIKDENPEHGCDRCAGQEPDQT